MNQLFFGDNLNILSKSIASESVDLICVALPFNFKEAARILIRHELAHD